MTSTTVNSRQPILNLQNISYSYHTLEGEVKALKDISFQVYSGEFISIVGPSGCGKTTLLNLLAGIYRAEKGNIQLQGQNLYEMKNREEIFPVGYMLQQDHLFEFRTIWENVILGLEIHHKMEEERISNVISLLKRYHLYEFKDKKPSQLSGGMRQRVALIRTLALNPEILLLDEPFSALDYQTRLEVSADIAKIIKENNKTAILVTHNLSEAIGLSQRIFVLSKRPAEVKRELKINLTLPEDESLGYRNAPEFNHYFNELWEDLKDDH